jgi:hypothetical protein
VTNYSCKKKPGRYINQGEIHYSIEYSGNMGNLPMYVKPQTLVVSFKDDKILFDITAPIGDAGISNLSNPKIEAYDTYVKLFGQKYIYSCQPGELPPGFDAMKGMEIKKTSKTTEICGFTCKNAEVTLANNRNKVYNVWYTNEINVKDPNSVTPFRDIDGVMLSFFYFMGGTELTFKAENVYKKDIPDQVFDRKEKYKPVQKEDMNSYMLKMISF